MPTTYLVTGASRGLGLGLIARILEQTDTHAVAAARAPEKSQGLQDLLAKYKDRLTTIKCDTSDEVSVEAAAEEVGNLVPEGLDYLINNAGIIDKAVPALQADASTMLDVYRTNVVGPFICTRAFHPLLMKKQRRVIVNISSGLGSIAAKVQALRGDWKDSQLSGSLLGYNCSKAALNMETLVLANALKGDNFTVISLCPGWVATDMGNTNGTPPLDVETSTGKQLGLIMGLTLADSGKYYQYGGNELEW